MMSRLAKPWLMAAAVALVAVGASGAMAGERPADGLSLNKMDQAAAERSWAIQAELARIEENRTAFVDELIGSWTPYLDPAVYDPWTELRPIAMKVPAWQLYGASLVGDYKTMVQVLRGKVGAGTYINTLAQPQPRMPVDPKNLGSYTDSLVFTPIAPCRIVDTRGTGARTGVVTGVPRVFDLTTNGYIKGQGGATSGCTGLPGYSHYGWSANITTVGYGANGGLQAYPYAGAVPATSIINFFPTGYAIANSSTLTGCDGCADDVTIAAFGSSTHVIIDVMGFFERAVATPNVAVSRVAGTPVAMVAGAFAFVDGGVCPAGTVMVGGEVDHNGGDLAVGEFREETATNWTFWMINNGGSATVTAYSRCMDQPVQIP